MTEPLSLLTALLLGLFGSSHCLVMCGGIAAAIGTRAGDKRLQTMLMFNSGRLLSYALLGLLVGSAGLWLSGLHESLMLMLRTLAAIMLILMGFYIARWWMVLTRFEQLGKPVWNALQPLTRRFMASANPADQLLLGMLWGLLPCGLIYSTLAWIAANGDPIIGSAAMLAFGIGTLPALFAGTLAGNIIAPWLSHPQVRILAAVLLIIFGAWTGAAVWFHS